MKTIVLNQKDIYMGNLILVNEKYPIINQGVKSNTLVPVDIKYLDTLMEFGAATALLHLMDDLNCKDEIIPVSGYRSYKEQEEIYSKSILDNGMEFTRKYVALPGHSEHQTGLAIDVGKNQEDIDFLCPEFPYDGICNEFRKIAHKYGFVQRYEQGKEDITGIAHESWHFRYVGYPHSRVIYEQGFSLEEYIEEIKKYPWNEEHLILDKGKQNIEISYIPIPSTGYVVIHLPNHAVYQISGNNVDGCIVTLWRI